MPNKIYTNCDKCNPSRNYPFQTVQLVYIDGKPVYLCDKCLDEHITSQDSNVQALKELIGGK